MSAVRALRAMVALGFLATIAGCDQVAMGPTEHRWTEDVHLQDGRLITLTRYTAFRGPQQTFAGVLSHYSVDFEHPVTKEKLRWESNVFLDTQPLFRTLEQKPEILPSLDLWAILLKDSMVYLVVSPRQEDVFRWLDCPDPPYLLYRWEEGTWRRKPLEDIPYRSFAINVSLNDDELIKRLKQTKHFVVDVPAPSEKPRSRGVIDLSRMSKQIADQSLCRGGPLRRWTAFDAFSN